MQASTSEIATLFFGALGLPAKGRKCETLAMKAFMYAASSYGLRPNNCVGVQRMPFCTRIVPLSCQPPTTRPRTPFCPLMKGSVQIRLAVNDCGTSVPENERSIPVNCSGFCDTVTELPPAKLKTSLALSRFLLYV